MASMGRTGAPIGCGLDRREHAGKLAAERGGESIGRLAAPAGCPRKPRDWLARPENLIARQGVQRRPEFFAAEGVKDFTGSP